MTGVQTCALPICFPVTICLIGLRTIWGVDLGKLNEKFSGEILEIFKNSIQPKLEEGILVIEENYLKIPEKHWFLADGIASDLFIL